MNTEAPTGTRHGYETLPHVDTPGGVEYTDTKRGVIFVQTKVPTGSRWSVLSIDPEGGPHRGLSEMLAYKTYDEANDAIPQLRRARTLEQKKQRYAMIPFHWDGEARTIAKAIIDQGIDIACTTSSRSSSKYITLASGDKIRMADHRLPLAYENADYTFYYGTDTKEFLTTLFRERPRDHEQDVIDDAQAAETEQQNPVNEVADLAHYHRRVIVKQAQDARYAIHAYTLAVRLDTRQSLYSQDEHDTALRLNDLEKKVQHTSVTSMTTKEDPHTQTMLHAIAIKEIIDEAPMDERYCRHPFVGQDILDVTPLQARMDAIWRHTAADAQALWDTLQATQQEHATAEQGSLSLPLLDYAPEAPGRAGDGGR